MFSRLVIVKRVESFENCSIYYNLQQQCYNAFSLL